MSFDFLPAYLGNREHRMGAFANPSAGLLSQFMTAGAVDILVQVREGMELALFYFLQTGLILDGDDIPLPFDRQMLALYEEIEDARDMQAKRDPIVLEQWYDTLPTAHVMLQSGAILPDFEVDGNNPGPVTSNAISPGQQPL